MLAAYYCFVNLGWSPSKYNDLPPREQALVKMFVIKSLEENQKAQENANKGVK